MENRDLLVDHLSRIRNDAGLRRLRATAEQALKQDQWLAAGIDPPRAYVRIVGEALHQFAREHLRKYFKAAWSDRSDTVALLSYSSSFGQHTGGPARITDYGCDSLLDKDPPFLSQTNRILDLLWKRHLATLPRRFEIHELAQRRIRFSDLPPVRVPIFICPNDRGPDWLEELHAVGESQRERYELIDSVLVCTRPPRTKNSICSCRSRLSAYCH